MGRLRTWLAATLRGELSPSGLQGLRAAGAAAYSLNEDADAMRLVPAFDPWATELGTELFLVCTWNAFALQTIGDQLLESSDTDLVPEASLAFAQVCFTQTLTWVESARFAQANATYRLTTPLPAELPAWPTFAQTRDEHVRALQRAYDAVAPRAESDLARLVSHAPRDRSQVVAEMNLLTVDMHTHAEFAAGLRSKAQSHIQLREACDELVRALRRAYTLGQVVAMPTLVERLQLQGYRAQPSGSVPVTAIEVGWPVLDRGGTRVGTVTRIEGEPRLGSVTAFVISLGPTSADRRVRLDQLQSVERGLVRLAASMTDLAPA
jgi:hypothetical protein